MVSVLTMGTVTFGGRGGFAAVGATDVPEARRQVDSRPGPGRPGRRRREGHSPEGTWPLTSS